MAILPPGSSGVAMRLSAKVIGIITAGCALAGCQSPGSLTGSTGLSEQNLLASTAMPGGAGPTGSPPGFAFFCLRFPAQCAVDPTAPTTITLNAATAEKLVTINREVNRAIWPEDDEKHYGRAEYWTIPTDGRGDCDDYAVTKRAYLLAAGLPENALRLATVITPSAVRHAVLTVSTDKGDFVLDNLSDHVLPWKDTGYQWLARQSATNAAQWVALDEAAAPPIVTAAISPAQAQLGEPRRNTE